VRQSEYLLKKRTLVSSEANWQPESLSAVFIRKCCKV